eukprot:gene16518-5050_t
MAKYATGHFHNCWVMPLERHLSHPNDAIIVLLS